jgi:hypothetical protein
MLTSLLGCAVHVRSREQPAPKRTTPSTAKMRRRHETSSYIYHESYKKNEGFSRHGNNTLSVGSWLPQPPCAPSHLTASIKLQLLDMKQYRANGELRCSGLEE